MDDRNQYDTPPEFPASPAQAALDETASRLEEAISLVRHVARDFDRLTSDQRRRVAAGLGREMQRISLAIAVTSGILTDLGAGREPSTWTELAIAERKHMTPNPKMDSVSVILLGGAGTVASTKPFGEVGSMIVAGGLALLSWLVGRLTPHQPAQKVQP